MPLPTKKETVDSILSAMVEIQDKELNDEQQKLLRKVDGILWDEIIEYTFTHLSVPDPDNFSFYKAACGTEIPEVLEADINFVDCLECLKVHEEYEEEHAQD